MPLIPPLLSLVACQTLITPFLHAEYPASPTLAALTPVPASSTPAGISLPSQPPVDTPDASAPRATISAYHVSLGSQVQLGIIESSLSDRELYTDLELNANYGDFTFQDDPAIDAGLEYFGNP